MLPVLFNLGGLPISSFGFFLLLGLLGAAFFIYRIVKVYDFDEEKILDLILLTFFGGLIGARVYFLAFRPDLFNSLLQVILINRYPGLSFWGALIAGIITLRFFCGRFKLNFWQVSDYAVIGLFIGISISSVGCLLGSCSYGAPFSGPFAVNQAGLIGKRFPIQIIESLLFLIGFFYLWKAVLRFHMIGQVASMGLIILGLFKFILEFFRGDSQVFFGVRLGLIWSALLFSYGLTVYYRLSKRTPKEDLLFLLSIFRNPSRRKMVIGKINKSWYNLWVNFKIALIKWRKSIFKLLNVKSNPSQF